MTSRVTALATALAFGLGAGVAQAATIQNGSFETGPAPGGFSTLGTGNTAITGWTVTSGNIDYIGSYWVASDGSRSLDMTGDQRGAISTTITDLIVGRTYELLFDLSGNPAGQPAAKQLDVTLSSPFTMASYTYNITTAGNTTSDMRWVTQMLSFVATSTSTLLTFAAGNGGGGGACCYGPALDNVRVELAPVPLPAGGVLLLSGLAGVAALRRRRKAA